MGGEVSLWAIEATNQVKVVALWALTSGNASDNANFYGGGRRANTDSPDFDGISPIITTSSTFQLQSAYIKEQQILKLTQNGLKN